MTSLFERMSELAKRDLPLNEPTVASFACYCGCQDEVLEPCPVEIPCWDKDCQKVGRMMHRWTPRDMPPARSARVWNA